MVDEELAAYVERRNAAILGDFEGFKAFSFAEGVAFTRDEVAEITWHKCRTAIAAAPPEVVAASKQWLTSRGYRSLD